MKKFFEKPYWFGVTYGAALVNDGNVVVAENTEVEQAQTSNPRTAIGMISPLHYVIIISDGRTDVSEGLTLYQLAGIVTCIAGSLLKGIFEIAGIVLVILSIAWMIGQMLRK